MRCLQCDGEVWDNTKENAERIEKGLKPRPQYACKNKACGWVMWEKDEKGATQIVVKSGKLTALEIQRGGEHTKEETPIQYRAMLFSYAKDCVVAELQMAQSINNPSQEIIKVYKEFLGAL